MTKSSDLDPTRASLRAQPQEDTILEALREVYDPELGLNVVELGLIRRVELADNRCHLEMILTTPFCPYAPALLQQVRDSAEIAAGVPVTVELGTEMWESGMMEEGAADDWGLW